MIQEGRFREDLFYRLSMVELAVPPLKVRQGDIELLARVFLGKWSKQYGRSLSDFTNRALLVLKRHNWPGNVRELENVIGHAAIMTLGPLIDAGDLPSYLIHPAAESPQESMSQATTISSLSDREKELVVSALKKSGSNQSEAARMLAISRDKLRYKIRKYGLG